MADSFNSKAYKDPFISSLVSYVAAEEFQTMFEKFFLENALEFTSDEEHKMIYYEIYRKFQKMFENQLEDFCFSQNISISDFVQKCREASLDDEKAKHYINILLSSVEYETFVKLMKIMRPVAIARQKLMLRAEAKSSDSETPSSPDKEGKGGAPNPAASPNYQPPAKGVDTGAKGGPGNAALNTPLKTNISEAKVSASADKFSDKHSHTGSYK